MEFEVQHYRVGVSAFNNIVDRNGCVWTN